eukprot:TRINITY_DN49239_c0_g1_i1.p1 TRINITY_DN49239_c0_g1~~TRINITY_DN49239_c0_g1_i1.p1  ORF type:complete len:751 (-),score=100.90 TRINITY_DN49239_c0_g1_i1:534-2516(-)
MAALVHSTLQNLSEKQLKWGASAYVVGATSFCFSIWQLLFFVTLPLSGVQDVFKFRMSADVANACATLAVFGPARMLHILFTCTLLLFAPVVLFVPSQTNRLKARLPRWATILLIRMYTVVFGAEITNCYYVFEFIQYLAATSSEATNGVPHTWVEHIAPGGEQGEFTFKASALPAMLHDDADVNMAAISGLALYVILMWGMLIIIYERLTNRSFKEDFPRGILIAVCPYLLRFESFAGVLAEYVSKERINEFADSLFEAKDMILQTSLKTGAAIDKVKGAFREARVVVRGRTTVVTHRGPCSSIRDEIELAHRQLIDEVCSALGSSLQWDSEDNHYFEQLGSLLTQGIDGKGRKEETGCDSNVSPTLVCMNPVSLFDLSELLQEFFRKAALAEFNLVSRAIETEREDCRKLCAVLNKTEAYTIAKLKQIKREATVLETEIGRLERHLRLLNDLHQDTGMISGQAEQLVHVISGVPFTRHAWYNRIYKATFLVLAVVGFCLTVGTLSMVFLFWDSWPLQERVRVITMLSPFVALISFSSIFASASWSGSLGALAHRQSWSVRAVIEDDQSGLQQQNTETSVLLASDETSASIEAAVIDMDACGESELPSSPSMSTAEACQLLFMPPVIAMLLVVSCVAFLVFRGINSGSGAVRCELTAVS